MAGLRGIGKRLQGLPWQWLVLGLLLGGGIAVSLWGPWDTGDLAALGEALEGRPWVLPVAAAVQAVLFIFAMPGSVVLWVVAPFYPPWMTTVALVVGSTAGALGGYAVARRLGAAGDGVAQTGRAVTLLARNGDFLTQCALRAFPGFPHAPVNYGAGVLGLPRTTFLSAAVVGLTVKWWVYASAIHGAVEMAEGESIGAGPVVALLLLCGLAVGGALLRRRLLARSERNGGSAAP